jgi:lipopolysaccharide export system protein LptA
MPIFIVFWAISVLASEPGVAETKEPTDPSTPVRITSTADSIKIFYKPGGDTAEVTSSIEKIVSQGNVKIVFDNKTKTAAAEKAVYTAAEKVLVLSGGEPTVWSGENVIRGKRITLFQSENRTLVEGDQNEQVEGMFYTKGEGGLIK